MKSVKLKISALFSIQWLQSVSHLVVPIKLCGLTVHVTARNTRLFGFVCDHAAPPGRHHLNDTFLGPHLPTIVAISNLV